MYLCSAHNVQAQIQIAGAMREPAGRNIIHPGGSNRGHMLGSNTTARLGDGLPGAALYSDLQLLGTHIIQQDDPCAMSQRLIELRKGIHLYFYGDHVTYGRPGLLQGLCYPASQGNMVVLDQHCIIQRHAMIHPATGTYRIFLQGTQARQSFAGAGDFAVVGFDAGTQICRCTRHATEMTEDIECSALSRQDRLRGPGNASDGLTGLYGSAIRTIKLGLYRAMQLGKDIACNGCTGQNTGLTGNDIQGALMVRGDQGLTTQIGAPG